MPSELAGSLIESPSANANHIEDFGYAFPQWASELHEAGRRLAEDEGTYRIREHEGKSYELELDDMVEQERER